MKTWGTWGLFLLLSRLSLAAAPWELYLSPDLSLALCKPQGWEVKLQQGPQSQTLVVSPPRHAGAAAVITLARASDTTNDSLAFAIGTIAGMREKIPWLELNWARSTQDRRRTMIEAHYRSTDGNELRFRGYFLMDYPHARMLGYQLPASEFSRQQPTMLSILSNLTVLNQKLLQPAAVQRLNQLTARPQPLPMSLQNLSDGSASMQVPQGWRFQGAQGMAFCLSPGEECGFCFATASLWAASRIPYFDNSALPGLHHGYCSPVEALALLMQQVGSSSIQVEQVWDQPDRAHEASQSLNRGAQCQSALLHYQTRQGVNTRGYFDVLNLAPLPSGQWLVIYWGVWAPAPSWGNWLPQIPAAASYRIQEQWAADDIRRGGENPRYRETMTPVDSSREVYERVFRGR